MNQSEERLFQYVKDFIRQQPPNEESHSEDWDEIMSLASVQSLDGIIFYQCKSIIPKDQKRKYLTKYLANASLSFERERILSEFTEYLERDNLQIVFMKGSVFRDYYPVSALRSMGDIDCIIRLDDRDKIDHILKDQMGFGRFIDNHSVWTYFKGNIYIEVHTHMFYENLANNIDYIGYFDHLDEYIKHGKVFGIESDSIYIPDESYHFLYLMTHTAKHIINSGSGFRAYLDMVLMAQKCELNWEWIKAELEKLKMLEFTETCFALCEKWFDVKMPLEHKELDPFFFEEITEKTFHDGVFGLANRANEGAHTAKEIKRENRGYSITALRLTLRILFPPYEDMILPEWYSFMRGRPYLLPIGWVYRWIYCIVHKFKASLKRLTEPFRIKKKIEKREDYISSWGL